MRVQGEEALSILLEQEQPVQVCDSAGVPFLTVTARDEGFQSVATALRSGAFFAIGNRRRIRRVQAKAARGAGWLGGSRTWRRAPVRDAAGVAVTAPLYEHRRLVFNEG
jgi:hypothetical protein